MDRLAEDQGLHLCRPPCKTGSGRYTDGVTWKRPRKWDTRRVPKEETRGFQTVETTGFFKSGDRLPQG